MIWIKGKIKFPDQIEADGSGLMDEYKEIKKMYKERFGEDIAKIDKRLKRSVKKKNFPRMMKLCWVFTSCKNNVS
mgnify:CR=1 FL=1